MTLSVDVRQRLGAFTLRAAFESSGRLTALFGTSGSGKSSLVNLIAGLTRPDEGRIVVGGRVLVDTAKGVFLPPHRRAIGYVFQDARLFPHMDVRRNLTYGRWFTPREGRYAVFDTVVDLLGIGHLLDRRPAMLSGGEKSRVAIGRALLASPKLILMDEPFASLDETRKAEIFPYLERLRDQFSIPIVYVSHSIAEVARLATDIVVLDKGTVRASGEAAGILSRPDLFPASERGEAGALIDLEVVEEDDGYGLSVLRSSAGEWRLADVGMPKGARLRARIRARDVMLATKRPQDISALNVITGVITETESSGPADMLLTVLSGTDRIPARITCRSRDLLGLTTGSQVHAIVKAVTIDAPGRRPLD